jgi:hypothetical protein
MTDNPKDTIVPRDAHGRWLPGQSANPAGRPPSESSWAGLIRSMMNSTPEQLADEFGDSELGKSFRKLPKSIPMRRQLLARVMAGLMFDPTPGLLSILLEREEGKVADKLDLSVRPVMNIRSDSRKEEGNAIDGEFTDSGSSSG